MTDRDDGQGDAAGRALEPLDDAAARAMTAEIREAIADVQRSVAALAHRVRAAHAARVWVVLGYGSWAAYAEAEFGVSRAQAYRLISIARTAGAIDTAVAVADPASRTRDTDPDAQAALDYGLSQRALLAVSGRTGDLAALITDRLTALAPSGTQALRPNTIQQVVQQAVDDVRVQAVVDQAVHDVRATPPTTAPVATPTDPAAAELRRVIDELVDSAQAIGRLMLEVAPAYLSDAAAADVLAPLCEDIGENLDHGLAARRYAITGDRRALHGTVL